MHLVLISNRDLVDPALGLDAAHPCGLASEARNSLACLAIASKGLRAVVNERDPNMAAACAKALLMAELPGLLKTFCMPLNAPSNEAVAECLQRLAQAPTAPALSGSGSRRPLSREKLEEAGVSHLAPQCATTEADKWMALLHFVRFCMHHPKMDRLRGYLFERVPPMLEEYPRFRAHLYDLMHVLQESYRAELDALMERWQFPAELGLFFPADFDQESTCELMYPLARQTLEWLEKGGPSWEPRGDDDESSDSEEAEGQEEDLDG